MYGRHFIVKRWLTLNFRNNKSKSWIFLTSCSEDNTVELKLSFELFIKKQKNKKHKTQSQRPEEQNKNQNQEHEKSE